MTTSFEGWRGGGGRVDSNSFIIIPKFFTNTNFVVTNSKFSCYVSEANLSALFL